MQTLILKTFVIITLLVFMPCALFAGQSNTHLGEISFKKETAFGYYWVQLNASKSKQNAIRAIKDKPSIKDAHLYKDENSLYRVIVGPYPSRFDAIKKVNIVRKIGFKDAFVRFTKTNQLSAHSIWLTRSNGTLIEKDSLSKHQTLKTKVEPQAITKDPAPSGEISIESWNNFIAEHHGAENISGLVIESSRSGPEKIRYDVKIELASP